MRSFDVFSINICAISPQIKPRQAPASAPAKIKLFCKLEARYTFPAAAACADPTYFHDIARTATAAMQANVRHAMAVFSGKE